MKTHNLKILFSFLLTVILGLSIWRFVNLRDLLETFQHMSWFWFGFSMVTFLIYQIFRSLRLSALLGLKAKNWKLFNTQCLQAFLNGTLPAGLGEAALIFLLKHSHQIPYSRAVASTLISRFVDLALFSVLFFGVGVFIWDKIPSELITIMSLLLGVLILIGFLMGGFHSFAHHPRILQGFLGPLREKAQKFLTAFYQLQKGGREFSFLFYSFAMWVAMYFYFLFTILALRFPLSWAHVLSLYLLVFPMNLLPVKGVANFGTHEAVWFLALKVIGLETSEAARLGFSSHLLFLTVLILTAILPILFQWRTLFAIKKKGFQFA